MVETIFFDQPQGITVFVCVSGLCVCVCACNRPEETEEKRHDDDWVWTEEGLGWVERRKNGMISQ